MKILADENIFEPVIEYLRAEKHAVFSVRDSKYSGAPDEEIYKIACRQKYVIVTMDKDFSRIFNFPPRKCGGIVVIKIYRRTVEETLKIFKKYFEKLKEKDIKRNLIIISPESVRIRRLK